MQAVNRVLVAHSYYGQFGGEDASFSAEADLLRARGINVFAYTKNNREINSYGAIERLGLGLRTTWSRATRAELKRILEDQSIDVAHFHNTFPLISPSGYSACRSAGVPVVQTLRNFRLFCVNGLFFRDGHVCEDCVGRTPPWPGVWHACYRSSGPQSAVVATMQTVHRFRQTWINDVDVYVVPSRFLRSKLIESGLRAECIEVKPNVLGVDPGPASGDREHALFVGRISSEKGLGTMLRAWTRIKGCSLKIVGDGPARPEAEQLSEHLALDNVEFLGEKRRDEVLGLMGGALFMVVPSEFYETFGRVGVEALSRATPVIASRLGALTETIADGVTGLHFAPGDPDDLAEKVLWALDNPSRLRNMGEQARRTYEDGYSHDANFSRLMEIYSLARDRAHRR